MKSKIPGTKTLNNLLGKLSTGSASAMLDGMMEMAGHTGAEAERFGSVNYIKITIFGFALAALWASLHTIILPIRLLDFVAESQKNTYLGLLTFAGLLLAIAVQPIAGAISDRSGFSWGRRRPYILIGTLLSLLFLPGLGLCSGYIVLFAIYCLIQISSNTAQAPYQAFIPDLVPDGKRGLASGVKSLLEILGGVILLYPVAFFIDRYFAGEGAYWLWLALGVLAIVLLGAMIATMVMVREKPGAGGFPLPSFSALYNTFKIDIRANRDFIWFLVSRLLMLMAFTTLQTFALYFLRDVVGVTSPAAATAKFSIVAVVGMLAIVYPAGRLSDRIGRRPILVTSGLLSALGISLIFLFQQSYVLIILCGGLIGISFGAFMSTNWALAIDLVAKGEEARYLGLTNLATAGGAALARLIGPLIDFCNNYGLNLGYQVMLSACFVYFVAGSLLLLKIRVSGQPEVG
ncbi:MAG TPA: MFS transporter [Dehalococcoidales bacterium]|nr:MFS transporter [Dehalococcoidales bacterium]